MPTSEPGRPLRLAFLADPNSVHTRRWLSWFADHGHGVHLLEGFGIEVAPGLHEAVSVERYGPYPPGRLSLRSALAARRDLRRLVQRLRPDVLHAHYVRGYGWHAALAAMHPYVVSPWGSDLLRGSRFGLRTRWWNRFAVGRADLVTVTTDHMRRAALAAGARAERIQLVQHGVDTQRFSPGPAAEELAQRLDVSGRTVVLSPRAVRPLYRHETVIDAFASLPGQAVLVMTRAAADPAYLAALEARIASRGITDRVRVLDPIPHQEMPGYLRLAGVVVSVPESDSFPVTLLEAMACGVPVVASDLPPAREVLEPIAPELVVPVGDAAALASAMGRALALTDAERRRLGDELRRYVVANADYEANMERMATLYQRLVGRT